MAAAKADYNNERYAAASKKFLALCQKYPNDFALLRSLARTRNWNGDAAGAAQAYRDYLALAPNAKDRKKIQAELELVEEKCGGKKTAWPTEKQQKKLNQMHEALAANRLVGENGAFSALRSALDMGLFGVPLVEAASSIEANFVPRAKSALASFLALDAVATENDFDLAAYEFRALGLVGDETQDFASAMIAVDALKKRDAQTAMAALKDVERQKYPEISAVYALALWHLGRFDDAQKEASGRSGRLNALISALAAGSKGHAQPLFAILSGEKSLKQETP